MNTDAKTSTQSIHPCIICKKEKSETVCPIRDCFETQNRILFSHKNADLHLFGRKDTYGILHFKDHTTEHTQCMCSLCL